MPARSDRRGARRLLAAAAFFVASGASAHEGEVHDYDEDRVTLSAGFGLYDVRADDPYPVPRLPGVLESGSARVDERDNGVDYAELALKANFTERFQGFVMGSYHGRNDETTEIEEAWLSGTRKLTEDWLAAKAGRQRVPLGILNTVHSHAWTFGVAPLAMRAVMNDSWRADGLQVNRQSPSGLSVGGGGWRNESFPGAPEGGANLFTLRAGWERSSAVVELGIARASSDHGRPLVTQGTSGHTHSLPSCDTLSAFHACFEGDATVADLTGRWNFVPQAWVGGEYLHKEESGFLDTIHGRPVYEGTVEGGWIDLGWIPAGRWEVVIRGERLVARHRLVGDNAGLVASQAGIADSSRPLVSCGVVVRWQPRAGHRLSAEYHEEDLGDTPNRITLLRYQFSHSKALL